MLQGAENPTDYIESHGGPTSSCAWHELQVGPADVVLPAIMDREL